MKHPGSPGPFGGRHFRAEWGEWFLSQNSLPWWICVLLECGGCCSHFSSLLNHRLGRLPPHLVTYGFSPPEKGREGKGRGRRSWWSLPGVGMFLIPIITEASGVGETHSAAQEMNCVSSRALPKAPWTHSWQGGPHMAVYSSEEPLYYFYLFFIFISFFLLKCSWLTMLW